MGVMRETSTGEGDELSGLLNLGDLC